MESLRVLIKGIVQGVGFRPFVYKLANELNVKGFVSNTSDGVVLSVEGEDLGGFLERLKKDSPPLCRIMSIEISPGELNGFRDFSIHRSEDNGSFTLIAADICVCPECLDELFRQGDRRFHYPFINCTNCGPRYSITSAVPYDRFNTTMKGFRMCGDCEAEYRDPSNRRFHAQPNACEVCGPHVSLIVDGKEHACGENAISKAVELLKSGKVVGIKGLGGFHLACDAENDPAVRNLRERKRKNNKPFALMAPNAELIKKFCYLSPQEEELLVSPRRPIVLLKKRPGALSEAIAPNNRHVGFMLPYTPLHYLLFGRMPFPFEALVMTSGNLTEEPLVTDNREALDKLSGIADAFLLHNRDIFMRVDDSVLNLKSSGTEMQESGNRALSEKQTYKISFIRRSRGYVPDPIFLGEDGPDVLGCGGDLKNTFTLTKGRYAIPSQHIGDMENYETLAFFEETLRNLKSLYRAMPVALAYDLHPEYFSTRWALKQGVKSIAVQHHYAHLLSVMAETGLREKVIGVAFDGTGYGEDGALWGGEFLIADLGGFKRAGYLDYVALPGGVAAIKEPWRTAVSYLTQAAGVEALPYLKDAGFVERYTEKRITDVIRVSENRNLSPLSSGAGRLFDAVSALTGVCDTNTFEGEAAMALESLVLEDLHASYPVNVRFSDPMVIDFSMTFLSILDDMRKREDRRIIATKFHNTVTGAIVATVLKLSATHNITKIVLGGGVFQNSYLLDKTQKGLRAAGLDLYVNELVPCNDAGISLGQAFLLREMLREGRAF